MIKKRVKVVAGVVHSAHYMDGYPLCWPMDAEGEFEADKDEKKVTCPECLEEMKSE